MTIESRFEFRADNGSSGPESRQRILSEVPIDGIWSQLRRLESETLAGKMISRRTDIQQAELNDNDIDSRAAGVAYAVRRASEAYDVNRMYLSGRIKTLLYGTLSLVDAEMLASAKGPPDLATIGAITRHGAGIWLCQPNDPFDSIKVGAMPWGLFGEWVKVMGLHDVSVVDRAPTNEAEINRLPRESVISLHQLLASIPEMGDLFEDVMDRPPSWVKPVYDVDSDDLDANPRKKTTSAILLVDDSCRISLESVASIPGLRDVVAVDRPGASRFYRAWVDHAPGARWWDALNIYSSPMMADVLIQPLLESQLPYRAICVMILYSLSQMVVYYPHLWRRVETGDLDAVRVLVKTFLDIAERVLPEQFLSSITGQAIPVRQPGSLV